MLDSTRTTVNLSVIDTGPGIKNDEREKVFERVFRGSNSVQDGNGLGLSIVKEIAESHNASIQISKANSI